MFNKRLTTRFHAAATVTTAASLLAFAAHPAAARPGGLCHWKTRAECLAATARIQAPPSPVPSSRRIRPAYVNGPLHVGPGVARPWRFR